MAVSRDDDTLASYRYLAWKYESCYGPYTGFSPVNGCRATSTAVADTQNPQQRSLNAL